MVTGGGAQNLEPRVRLAEVKEGRPHIDAEDLSRRIDGASDVTTGRWRNGRIGIYNGILDSAAEMQPLIRIWGETGTTDFSGAGRHGGTDRGWNAAYDGLLRAMVEFFHTRRPPVVHRLMSLKPSSCSSS